MSLVHDDNPIVKKCGRHLAPACIIHEPPAESFQFNANLIDCVMMHEATLLAGWTRNPRCCAKCAVTKPAANIMEWPRVTAAGDFSKEAFGGWLPCKTAPVIIVFAKHSCSLSSSFAGTWTMFAKKMETASSMSLGETNASRAGSRNACRST